LARNLALGITG